jgi:hypothetical protein
MLFVSGDSITLSEASCGRKNVAMIPMIPAAKRDATTWVRTSFQSTFMKACTPWTPEGDLGAYSQGIGDASGRFPSGRHSPFVQKTNLPIPSTEQTRAPENPAVSINETGNPAVEP